jgi:formylglycine-generating enzyme
MHVACKPEELMFDSMKRFAGILILSTGVWFVIRSIGLHDPGRTLLDEVMDKPGSWSQMCASPPPIAFDPPLKRQGPNDHVLIVVPAGEYKLGAADTRTNPVHKAALKTIAIAEAETTNAQFAAFVKATAYQTSAEKDGGGMVFHEGMKDWEWEKDAAANWRKPFGEKGPSASDLPTHPVTQISGRDALEYCQWLGARLPTLDEWEAAARAGAATKYPWGDTFDPKRANIWNGATHRADTKLDGFLYTAPVKSFPPNAWGLYDVIGNVFEYCSGFPPHISPEQSSRLIAGRGGSWWCSQGTCSFFNLVDIGSMDRQGSLANQGFRVAFNAEEAAPFSEPGPGKEDGKQPDGRPPPSVAPANRAKGSTTTRPE